MRRTTRSGQKPGHSEKFPDVDSGVAGAPQCEVSRAAWMPTLRFVQNSPHAGETHVDGKSEVVHWVVKDRPFSIRVLEVPSAPGDYVPEGQSSETMLNSDLAWSDVEVEADVVFTATHLSVKPSTGLAPLQLDRSVIPPNIYNHRRSANNTDTGTDPESGLTRVLKLKEGAGLELLVRLSILSSHLRNNFCIHLKVYIRQQLVASWFSETIRSVSKWDKVSQKPVSASIIKADPSAMHIDDDDSVSTSSLDEITQTIPTTSRASSSSSAPAPRASTHSSSKYAKKKKASGEEVFDMLQQLRSNFDELERLAHAPGASKKRRATWDASLDAYPTAEEAQRAAQRELRARPSPAASTSSSQTSTRGNNILRFKKFKLAEVDETEAASPATMAASSTTSPDAASTLATYANQFLQLIDTMPPSEVRNALSSVLTMRPELMDALGRLMKYEGASNNSSSCAVSCAQSIVQPSFNAVMPSSTANHGIALNSDLTPSWSTSDMMLPGLSASSQIMINQPHSELWNEERYALGQEIAGGLNSGSSYLELPAVMSPSAFDDDSTTMGSPSTSYASWGDEWQSQPVSPLLDSSIPQATQLTDSSLFPVLMETDGF